MTMMNCTQFRESLDCYIDRELSAEAMSAAERHRAACPACDRLAAGARDLQAAVRQTVNGSDLPNGLAARVRAATTERTLARRLAWLAAAAAVLMAIGVGLRWPGPIERRAANAMDGMALRLDGSSEVELHGVLLCRDCELERRFGIVAPCRRIGHHGAIATPDGRIWNIVEQATAADLIHDESLLGRPIVVRGRFFRGARTLVIDSYQFQS